MKRKDEPLEEQLRHDLEALRLHRVLEVYREVLDQASSAGWSYLQLLAHLMGSEASARAERALQRRIKYARLPKLKTLEEYDFSFPKRIPKQKILRVFDCDFLERHGNVVLVGKHKPVTYCITSLCRYSNWSSN